MHSEWLYYVYWLSGFGAGALAATCGHQLARRRELLKRLAMQTALQERLRKLHAFSPDHRAAMTQALLEEVLLSSGISLRMRIGHVGPDDDAVVEPGEVH